MKYEARAIVWGHKVIKGKIDFEDVPAKFVEKVTLYLTHKGHDDLIPSNEVENKSNLESSTHVESTLPDEEGEE